MLKAWNCPTTEKELFTHLNGSTELQVAHNDWSQNRQPRSPIWVAPAHVGLVRPL